MKRIKLYLFLLLLINSLSLSQDLNKSNYSDSAKVNNNSKTNDILNNSLLTNSLYFELGKPFPNEFFFKGLQNNFYGQYIFDESFHNNNLKNIDLSKANLSKALQIQYQMIKARKLGAFGKVLGYAVGATAVGLGVYSIVKYGKYYW